MRCWQTEHTVHIPPESTAHCAHVIKATGTHKAIEIKWYTYTDVVGVKSKKGRLTEHALVKDNAIAMQVIGFVGAANAHAYALSVAYGAASAKHDPIAELAGLHSKIVLFEIHEVKLR